MVGHGKPAVSNKSRSSKGVVMTLRSNQSTVRMFKRTARHWPIDVANIKDLAIHAVHFGVAALELDRDRCLSQIGTHWKVRDRGD